MFLITTLAHRFGRQWKHRTQFLHYLNNCHTTIKFTVEFEDNSTIPFLEILIKRHSYTFSTSFYRKKTFTGLYTKWDSFTPTKYKVNLIRTLNYNFVVSASVPHLVFCTLVWMNWGSCCCKIDTLLVISVTTLMMFWTGSKANRPHDLTRCDLVIIFTIK